MTDPAAAPPPDPPAPTPPEQSTPGDSSVPEDDIRAIVREEIQTVLDGLGPESGPEPTAPTTTRGQEESIRAEVERAVKDLVKKERAKHRPPAKPPPDKPEPETPPERKGGLRELIWGKS